MLFTVLSNHKCCGLSCHLVFMFWSNIFSLDFHRGLLSIICHAQFFESDSPIDVLVRYKRVSTIQSYQIELSFLNGPMPLGYVWSLKVLFNFVFSCFFPLCDIGMLEVADVVYLPSPRLVRLGKNHSCSSCDIIVALDSDPFSEEQNTLGIFLMAFFLFSLSEHGGFFSDYWENLRGLLVSETHQSVGASPK